MAVLVDEIDGSPHRVHHLRCPLDKPYPFKHPADWVNDVPGLHKGGGDFYEQRGKEKEIAAAHESYFGSQALLKSTVQGQGGIHPTETTADDDDGGALARFHAVAYDIHTL
jgi:hypothetical protein